MKKALISACVVAAALASCATGQKATSLDSLSGEWSIVKVGDKNVKAADGQDMPFIGFDTNKKLVYGYTGCNRLTGSLNADPKSGKIDFGATGSTRMMCHDMTTENLVLGALGKVKTYKVNASDKLTLCDENGKAVFEMQKKK